MRLILIVVVVLSGLGFGVFKTYSYFAGKKQVALEQKQAHERHKLEAENKKLEEKLAAVSVPDPAHRPGAVPTGAAGVPDLRPAVSVPPVTRSVGSYRFVHRLVPPAPGFLKNESNAGMIVETDEGSNSWVWIGEPVLCSQILDMAKSYDLRQIEMDLDFVLVLVNTEKLKTFGFSVFYDESASWLNALSLQGDTGSLRIASNGFAVDLEMSNDKTGLSVLSQPVVRVLDGQPWKFETDSEVPIPNSEVIDGVIRRNVDFRKIGFGLDGMVRVVGDLVLLQIEQRNGSIAPAASKEAEYPIFNVQSLKTSVQLAFSEWSVLGGIQVDREETRKGIFRDSLKVSSDYLVIFVRPRLSLEAPPQAVPVTGASNQHHPLLLGNGVLPPKSWIDEEIRLIEEKTGSEK